MDPTAFSSWQWVFFNFTHPGDVDWWREIMAYLSSHLGITVGAPFLSLWNTPRGMQSECMGFCTTLFAQQGLALLSLKANGDKWDPTWGRKIMQIWMFWEPDLEILCFYKQCNDVCEINKFWEPDLEILCFYKQCNDVCEISKARTRRRRRRRALEAFVILYGTISHYVIITDHWMIHLLTTTQCIN